MREAKIKRTSTPALAKQDFEALAAFRFALRRFISFSNAAVRELDLTPQQHQALLAIKGVPEESLTVGGLAKALLLQHHSAVELAKRLEQGDLISRVSSTEDRRRVMLTLTPQAEVLLGRLSAIHLEELANIAPLIVQALQALEARTARSRG